MREPDYIIFICKRCGEKHWAVERDVQSGVTQLPESITTIRHAGKWEFRCAESCETIKST